MDVLKCLSVLVVLYLEGTESGGHHGGHHHHSHLKIHLPEFIHHDHHTKVITIHHHHGGKGKDHHHHHHHHHHHKPHIPHGHHYHHHKKGTHTVLKGHTVKHGHKHHKHHGHHGHHHGHQHGHHHHGHHHHDYPSYEPTSVGFEEDFGTYSPPASLYGDQGTPHLHGIQHTVKQVKVFDSIPAAIPPVSGVANIGFQDSSSGYQGPSPGYQGSSQGYQGSSPGYQGSSPGYQVTEEGEEDDEFTSVNSIQQSYPGTYAFLRGAAPQPSHDPFEELSQATIQTQQEQFMVQPTLAASGGDTFTSHNPFSPSAEPTQVQAFPSESSVASTPELVTLQGDGFNDPANSYVGDVSSTPLLSVDETAATNDTPVSFHREGGIQQLIQTGGHEVLTY